MDIPSCPPCPNCGEPKQVRYTVTTDVGSYCRCAACGFVWHHEFISRPPLPDPTPHQNAK